LDLLLQEISLSRRRPLSLRTQLAQARAEIGDLFKQPRAVGIELYAPLLAPAQAFDRSAQLRRTLREHASDVRAREIERTEAQGHDRRTPGEMFDHALEPHRTQGRPRRVREPRRQS